MKRKKPSAVAAATPHPTQAWKGAVLLEFQQWKNLNRQELFEAASALAPMELCSCFSPFLDLGLHAEVYEFLEKILGYAKVHAQWTPQAANPSFGYVHILKCTIEAHQGQGLSRLEEILEGCRPNELSNQVTRAQWESAMGYVRFFTADRPKALSHFERSAALFEAQGMSKENLKVRCRMSNILKDTLSLVEWSAYCSKGLKDAREIGVTAIIPQIFFQAELASCFMHDKQIHLAERLVITAIKDARHIMESATAGFAVLQLARLSLHCNRPQDALNAIEMAEGSVALGSPSTRFFALWIKLKSLYSLKKMEHFYESCLVLQSIKMKNCSVLDYYHTTCWAAKRLNALMCYELAERIILQAQENSGDGFSSFYHTKSNEMLENTLKESLEAKGNQIVFEVLKNSEHICRIDFQSRMITLFNKNNPKFLTWRKDSTMESHLKVIFLESKNRGFSPLKKGHLFSIWTQYHPSENEDSLLRVFNRNCKELQDLGLIQAQDGTLSFSVQRLELPELPSPPQKPTLLNFALSGETQIPF